jgi:hypothetical protein
VQLLCLDVHPSRPNLAATGSSGGCVALWDLRFQAAPLALTGSPAAAGDVWEVSKACTLTVADGAMPAAVHAVLVACHER